MKYKIKIPPGDYNAPQKSNPHHKNQRNLRLIFFCRRDLPEKINFRLEVVGNR